MRDSDVNSCAALLPQVMDKVRRCASSIGRRLRCGCLPLHTAATPPACKSCWKLVLISIHLTGMDAQHWQSLHGTATRHACKRC